MSIANNGIDLTFEGAGTKPGLEIWCVENLQLVPIPRSDHGKFYTGNAYVVLNTFLPRIGAVEYNIHYWLGEDANEVASALASEKALELDMALDSCAVQYREIQGHETQKFLSYFRPCIIPVKGVYSSQPGKVSEAYKIRLLTCKGNHAVSVKEVPFSRSSLNHDDVFILDTASKIFLFSGCNSTTQERAKALDVVQYIKENKHSGKCEIASVEDGKFVGDSDVGEFWSFFGGYAPIPKDLTSSAEKQIESSSRQLFWITLQGKLSPSGDEPLMREMLESNKCYMLDCGPEIFVWMGKQTSVTERKTLISAIEKAVRNQGRSSGTPLTLLTEGLENSVFRSYFKNWPQVVETKLYDDGREKVAAIFKHQGFDVRELPNEEDYQPCINCQGKIKVWHVNGDELFLVPLHEQTKLFSGDCYIVQYTYPRDGKDDNLFYAWFGRDSVREDRASATLHISTIADSIKGNAVVAQIHQDKEPQLFFLIFHTLIFFKGGSSKAYKKFLEENGIVDETYDENKTALFRVQGTSPENMQAIQVNLVSSSLNSSYCYIFQIGSLIFTWLGNLSSTINQALLDRMLDQINPTWQAVSVREGSEPEIFWNSLGGKTEYPREKEIRRHVEDPCLFVVTSTDGDFKVKNIHNFTQDDLTTEDVLILDCQEEIYVWIGLHSTARSKARAISLGQKFLETHLPVGRPSPGTPIYVVTEGQEPPFFTQFFEWDSAKANMIGNSFERKLAVLKGNKGNEFHQRSSRKPSSREPSPVGTRSKSVTSNGRRNSLSPASSPSDSKSNTSKNHAYRRPPLFSSKFSPGSITPESKPPLQNGNRIRADPSNSSPITAVYPYEQLRVDSTSPLKGINVSKREAYLSGDEFQEKFGMTKQAFYELPRWRQNKLKLAVNLF